MDLWFGRSWRSKVFCGQRAKHPPAAPALHKILLAVSLSVLPFRFALCWCPMSESETVYTYLRQYSAEIGQRILEQFPPLHGVGNPLSPLVRTLLRRPFRAQSTVLMGLVEAWQNGARNAVVLGEMGTGKTLIPLGAVHVHSDRRPYNAVAMVPPHLVNKWAREAIQTIPRIRVFFIDGFRDATSDAPNGIHEVRLRRGGIIRDALSTTLSDLRLRKHARNARARWLEKVRQPSLFILGRETAKLGASGLRCKKEIGILARSIPRRTASSK